MGCERAVASACMMFVAITTTAFCFDLVEVSLKASCVISNTIAYRGMYYVVKNRDVVVSCILANQSLLSPASNLNESIGTMKVTIQNSTFHKVYRTSWTFSNSNASVIIRYADLFNDIIDYEDPVDFRNYTLIWQTFIEFCHYTAPSCIFNQYRLAFTENVGYSGHFISETFTAKQTENNTEFLESVDDRILPIKLSCNQASALVIVLPNSTTTKHAFLAMMTSSYRSEDDKWLLYSADLQIESDFHFNISSVYQAVLVENKLFLLTSSGLFVTSSLPGCWFNESFHCGTVYFTLVQSPSATFTINWKMSELFFDVQCDSWDYKIEMDDSVNNRLYLKVCGDTQEFIYSSLLSDLKLMRDEKFILPWPQNSSTCENHHLTFLHPSHVFLVRDSAIWWSFDGGLLFTRSIDFNETILSVAKHDQSKKMSILLNNGMIIKIQAGTSPRSLQSQLRTNASRLGYDGFGNLFALQGSEVVDLSHLETVNDHVICKIFLIPGDWRHVDSVLYIDKGDEVEISATAVSNFSAQQDLLSVTFSNAQLLDPIVTSMKPTPYSERVSIVIQNMGSLQGSGIINFMLVNAESSCMFTSYIVHIRFSCPPNSRILFDYSSLVGAEYVLPMEEFVDVTTAKPRTTLLPKNYFPPSSLGISIPLSNNIYNYDPEIDVENWILDYGISDRHMQKSGNMICTPARRFSSLEKYAMCRQRVYEAKFRTEYHLKFNISSQDNSGVKNYFNDDEYLIYIEEINGRSTDIYEIIQNAETFCGQESDMCHSQYSTPKENGHFLMNSTAITVKFSGTGLFHFRITVSQVHSFCKLCDEFQVYVTNPPMPFPVGIAIRLTVSFIIGLTLLLIYMKSMPGRNRSSPLKSSKQAEDSSSAPTNNPLMRRRDIRQDLRSRYRKSS